MIDTPLVTVVMPVYNEEKTIARAINSLLFQTYNNWRCIIINDGSTDNTKHYLDKLTDKRFDIIHLSQNMGRPYARQLALDKAEGKYLAMLDADDFYHPNKLEIQVGHMEENPEISLLGCALCSFGTDVNFVRIRGKGNGTIIKFHKDSKSPVTHAPSLLRMDIAKKHKYNQSLKLAQDVDFLSRYLNGTSYMVISNVLYYYSEFDSMSVNKVLSAYYYCIIKSLKTFKSDWKFALKYLTINIAKLLVGGLTYPLRGIDSVLKSRGAEPSQQERAEFDELILKVNHNNL
ncbi:MAG: glycosyltransferase family 2 protein [Mucilaginibacter sp.]